MPIARRKKIVLLGMMTQTPFSGNLWLILHYLIGFRRLGYDAYYVEAHGVTPTKVVRPDATNGVDQAVGYIAAVMHRFGFDHHWAYHARHADGRVYGLSEHQLKQLYASAELVINLHGGTVPLPEHTATGRLVYLETDPVALELHLQQHPETAEEFAEPYRAMFTWGENYGHPDCRVPVPRAFRFHPTRAPVLLDAWRSSDAPCDTFTTVGNWRQFGSRRFNGQVYRWSEHYEFLKVLDLPQRTRQRFELALSATSLGDEDRTLLECHDWRVRDSLSLSQDLDAYRQYIQHSRGAFTVAKDQNVRLRSGWFGERSATYLAAGRPVITQETGFSNVLPTGCGLFRFSTIEEVERAVEDINADYERHRRAAVEIARCYFSYDVVLPRLLADAGV